MYTDQQLDNLLKNPCWLEICMTTGRQFIYRCVTTCVLFSISTVYHLLEDRSDRLDRFHDRPAAQQVFTVDFLEVRFASFVSLILKNLRSILRATCGYWISAVDPVRRLKNLKFRLTCGKSSLYIDFAIYVASMKYSYLAILQVISRKVIEPWIPYSHKQLEKKLWQDWRIEV